MSTRERITMERTFEATLEDVWELWTTKDGIESWWGPEGFEVEVRTLDLRVGGLLLYAMIARAKEQIAFLERAGMPLVNVSRVTFTEVSPLERLAYVHLADFVPGVAPYDVATSVDLAEDRGRVRMTLSFDAMHDAHWTRMAVMGWESELGKLARVLSARTKKS